MKETELAERFIEYYGDNADVYFEVPIGGRVCDIVVNRSPVIIAIEVKTSMNLDVLEQAIAKIGYANYVYIAVPSAKGRFFIEDLCKQLGIGILYYDKKLNHVRERVKAKLYRKIAKPKLAEWMKANTAGSQSTRITAFKHFVNELYRYLNTNDGATYKQCFESIDKYYTAEKNFKSNIYQYVRRNIIKHINIENGKLYLDKAGYQEYLQEQMKLYKKHFY